MEGYDRNKRGLSFLDVNYLLDLGKEMFGGLKVYLSRLSDVRVSVMMGEQLNEDGHVRHEMAAGPDYIENWTLVKGQNVSTTLQMKNSRYVELLGFEGDCSLELFNGWAR